MGFGRVRVESGIRAGAGWEMKFAESRPLPNSACYLLGQPKKAKKASAEESDTKGSFPLIATDSSISTISTSSYHLAWLTFLQDGGPALNRRRLLLLYLRRRRRRRLKYVKRFCVRPKRFWDWLLVFFVCAIRKYCSNYLTTLRVFASSLRVTRKLAASYSQALASSLRAVFAMSGKEP